MNTKPTELDCIRIAYISLLRLPQGLTRFAMQSVLCSLLDVLAAATGRDKQEVQNECEAIAAGE